VSITGKLEVIWVSLVKKITITFSSVWSIEAKGATSFGLLIREYTGVVQNYGSFEFTIIKSPDNTIVQCSTYSYPP